MDFSPAMKGAREVLASALAIEAVADAPAAWGLFGAVAYASWLDRPDKVLAAFSGASLEACDARARRTIVLEGGRALLRNGRFGEARRILERADAAPADNEFRYYYGEVLYNDGAADSARKVFEAMLLARPGDVYSERARLFLSRMNAGGRHGDSMDEKRPHR
jgi:tetratricopeptide (TPR) repeat protein